jgi:hypothetical protein
MRKVPRAYILVTVLFLIAASAAVWRISRRREAQTVSSDQSGLIWKLKRHEIDPVASLSGQADLSDRRLMNGEIEARMWWGFGLRPLEGITLRRNNGQWSAIHVKADSYFQPKKAEREELRPPKSGWDAAWDRLMKGGIFTLADASDAGCVTRGIDAFGFVIEINSYTGYRAYLYLHPVIAKCKGAEQMLRLFEILYGEFRIGE